MSGVTSQDPHRDLNAPSDAPEIPTEFSEAYRTAYRRVLAEHPTELMLVARPGKRAAPESGALSRVTKWLAALMLKRNARLALVSAGAAALIFLAYGAGRLAA